MTEYTFDDLTIVMGTYSEEQAIGSVLADIGRITDGRAKVVCVDGSDGRTPEVARKMGARAIGQEPQGYGIAVEAAALTLDRPVVITADCDNTHSMEHLPKLLDLINDSHDIVSDDQITKGVETMPRLSHAENIAFTHLASFFMGATVHDTTTDMRAYRRELLHDIRWMENTGLSAELLTCPAMRGCNITEAPIPYRERAGETKLDSFASGVAIGKSIIEACLGERLRL